mgnify:CR=1 FL=1
MFRDNLNRICKEKGTSLTRLCKDLKISTSKVTAINRGSIPSEEMLHDFAGSLHCSIADFFNDNVTSHDFCSDEDEIDLMTGFRALSRQQKHKLLAYLYQLNEGAVK